jgi:hypothetical protein
MLSYVAHVYDSEMLLGNNADERCNSPDNREEAGILHWSNITIYCKKKQNVSEVFNIIIKECKTIYKNVVIKYRPICIKIVIQCKCTCMTHACNLYVWYS